MPGVPPPFYVLPHRSSCSHATAARQPSSDLRWSRCGQAGAVPHGRAQLSRLRRLSQQTTPSTTVTQRGISQMTGRRGDTAQPSCSIPAARAQEFHQEKVLPCPFSPRCIRAGGDNWLSFSRCLHPLSAEGPSQSDTRKCVFVWLQRFYIWLNGEPRRSVSKASTHNLVVGYWKEAVEKRGLSGKDGAEGRVSWTVETSRLVQGS